MIYLLNRRGEIYQLFLDIMQYLKMKILEKIYYQQFLFFILWRKEEEDLFEGYILYEEFY